MARNALFSRCRPISSHSSRSLAVRRREKGPSGPLTGYKESFISPSMTELLDIFRALADPTRLRIVALLREMELAIGELAVVLRSEEHTSELQSLMRISYAVFCLKNNKTKHTIIRSTTTGK